MSRRIALISEHASPLATLGGVDNGGQNVYVAQTARHLAALGYLVDVYTRRDDPELEEVHEWAPGVRIIHVPAGPPSQVNKEELLPYMKPFAQYMIRRIKREGPYDLIHANFWMSGLVAMEVKRALGIPFVITFHALGRVRRIHQGKKDNFPDERFDIEEQIVAEADRVIAECPQEQEDLDIHYQADPARITIVPAGFDPQELEPIGKKAARKHLGLSETERIIVQVGRIVPRKGVRTVIEGLARLIRDHGVEARLLVVGGESEEPDPATSPELARLMKVARDEGVEDQVTFVGRRGRERLKYYYSAADVFVSTPWYEPFGITPLEAMACGTPVVGSNVGGIKYSVADGQTGFLVPPKDPNALAQRLADLFMNPDLLKRFGKQAVRHVNKYFTWEIVARQLAAVYEEVIQASTPGEAVTVQASAEADEALVAEALVADAVLADTRVTDSLGTETRISNVLVADARMADAEIAQAQLVSDGFSNLISALSQTRAQLAEPIREFGQIMARALQRGGKILICGNGGSAADAQHFAAELTGRFQVHPRRALPAIALNADPVLLTAWANDVGFDQVFARQVEAFGHMGDILIVLSTSGNSKNLIEACSAAQRRGITCLALLGKDGGKLAKLADQALVIPAAQTTRIQEVQMLVLHLVCELIEMELFHRAGAFIPIPADLAKGCASGLGLPVKEPGSPPQIKRNKPYSESKKRNREVSKDSENSRWKSNSGNRRSPRIG